jgi:hypothetical protein
VKKFLIKASIDGFIVLLGINIARNNIIFKSGYELYIIIWSLLVMVLLGINAYIFKRIDRNL